MSITREESELLEKFDSLSPAEKEVMDTTCNTVFSSARTHQVRIANDDTFARFEAALIRLIIESRPG